MSRPRPLAVKIDTFHHDIPAYTGMAIIPSVTASSTGDVLRKWVFSNMPETTDYATKPMDLREAKRYLGWSALLGRNLDEGHILGAFTGMGLENWRQIEESLGTPAEERLFPEMPPEVQ